MGRRRGGGIPAAGAALIPPTAQRRVVPWAGQHRAPWTAQRRATSWGASFWVTGRRRDPGQWAPIEHSAGVTSAPTSRPSTETARLFLADRLSLNPVVSVHSPSPVTDAVQIDIRWTEHGYMGDNSHLCTWRE